MTVVSMRELLEAGVHFGHWTRRWNPRMKRFIYGKRQDIYIIDLHKTLTQLEQAYAFVRDKVAQGGKVLFVGTKRQAQEPIQEAARMSKMFYVTSRWLPGTLTNFETIRSRVEYLNRLREMEASGLMDALPKKDSQRLRKERDKLAEVLAGIEGMERLPDVLYVVDVRREEIAINEAKKMGIPVVAIVDTNCDPDLVDFPIPANDDAIRSIRLITSKIGEAAKEGFALYEALKAEGQAEVPVSAASPVAAPPSTQTVIVASSEDEEVVEDLAELMAQYSEPPEEEP
ncbi:MAG: 30S ribosomal protein S2 [Armatimonadetes bacterium]|nr:30S ribosomal protein S2 [Armatimonadota bacterium]MDW8122050.1 30S ribosomal protein S2 [Armatimonadota bacterium]